MRPSSWQPIALAILLLASCTTTPVPPEPRKAITVSDWLVLGPLPSWGRRPFAPSPVAKRYLLSDGREGPREGETVPWPGAGELTWIPLGSEGEGGAALGNGYAFATVESPRATSAILEGKGTTVAWVNGDPVVGDVYKKGRLRVPVRLRKGTNRIFARAYRGGLEVRLVPGLSVLDLNSGDVTLPDHRAGVELDAWGAIPVLNPTDRWVQGATVEVGGEGHFAKTRGEVPSIAPLGLCKVPFRIRCREGSHPIQEEGASFEFPLAVRWGGATLETRLGVELRQPGQTYKETFISELDGSVQYYAVRPPREFDPEWRYALILSLHGAGVNARGQADAYTPKEWAFVVAPTNRRPFGFDWEDWGRLDALEALGAARQRYPIDPDRIFLSGHSMGGHGVWHLGVTHPGLFAGIAPSAGWISFWSYGGGNLRIGRDPIEDIFRRATNSSDTLSLLKNLQGVPVFIIHGEKDDNVPAAEARQMVSHLESFHNDFVYREFPGKGHWWDIGETPGTDCVDHRDLWEDLFPRRRDPLPRTVSFTTMDPGTSHRRAWLEILAQERPHEVSTVSAKADPPERRIEITTRNVTALGLDLRGLLLPGPVEVQVDNKILQAAWKGGGRLGVAKGEDGTWGFGAPPGGTNGKRPGRSGLFKKVLARRFVMILGTGGTDEENRAALRRARLDSQVWWYRANGLAEIVPDTGFDPEEYKGRNWILYGHVGMNRVLAELAGDLPVRPEKGAVVVGDRRLEGSGLACLAVAPHPTDPDTLIGIVGGSDAAGITLSGLTSIIRSGIGYPDFCVWSDAVLEKGLGGVMAAGFLDASWNVDPNHTVIR